MVFIRTISSVITAIFTVGIYDRIGPPKDGPDIVDKLATTTVTIAKNSLQESGQLLPPQPPKKV